MGETIFKSLVTMPPDGMTEIDTPVRVRQVARDGKNALSPSPQTENMDVENCCRPRRGHAY